MTPILNLKISNLLILIFLFSLGAFSQQIEKYAKATIIFNAGQDLKTLANLGIETDHGIYKLNRSFTSDFSYREIELMQSQGFEIEILIDDVSSYYATTNRKSELGNSEMESAVCSPVDKDYEYKTPLNYKGGSMGGYLTYAEMMDQLDSMHAKYPNLISSPQLIDTIRTHNGNQIYFLRVSNEPITENIQKPQVLYTALHHAREPNSLSQMIFYLWYLLENYDSDPIVKKIVDHTQMYFIPCINPDGYIINQTNNPGGGGLWRKNAWKNENGELKGVDLNRNYGFSWGYNNNGSSNNPNSETYRGTNGFSEPETQAVRNFCNQRRFEIALNYHSFGNYLIHPWGFEDGPTAEDYIFKGLGRVMNRQNQFLLGTAVETVNYTVNGTSDDWMFGDTVSKQKIYAMTPEVGYAFWPARIDIDYLNKSNVWMNLSTALLTLNYYDAIEEIKSSYLDPLNKKIFVKVQRVGLKSGPTNINLTSKNIGYSVLNPIHNISLDLGQDTLIAFDIFVSPNIQESDLIFDLKISMDSLNFHSALTKKWIPNILRTLYKNELTTFDGIESTNWSTSDKTFISAPTSMTDSPNGDYENGQISSLKFLTPISLRDAKIAYLHFDAKWDIEEGYDYVTVSASSNNSDYIPLCGVYSSLGKKDQLLNTPQYDGTQKDWIREGIDLSSFLGLDNITFKFDFVSDGFNTKDGFYFDNFEVKVYEIASNTTDDSKDQKIYPSVIHTGQKINFTNILNVSHGRLTNVLGQSTKLSLDGDGAILNSTIAPGLYSVQLYDFQDRIIYTSKLVVVN